VKVQAKAETKRTENNLPVHSFQTLLNDLGAIVKDQIQPATTGATSFEKITSPTPLQQRAFDLLGITLTT
jgi:hypothetical protein|tara:strand:- start:161 stop:370 length:210 start_codon:yes stop_codon:yes gene_type:complete